MVSMTGSRLLSALLSPSLLPGLMCGTVSQLGPGINPKGSGAGQAPSKPNSFLFLSSDPTFLHLPLGPPAVGSEAFCLQDGVHCPTVSKKKVPLTILPTLTRLPMET